MEVMKVPQARSRISLAPSMLRERRAKKGDGVMDVLASAGRFIAPRAKNLAINLARKGADKAVDYLTKKITGDGIPLKSAGANVGIPLIVTPAQRRKLKAGGAITIKPSMMSDAANEILSLLPASAKKIMASLGKEKGIRHSLMMGEDLLNKMTGKGILDDFKKAFEPIRKSAEKTFTPALGRDIAKVLIDEALPAAIQYGTSSLVGSLTGNPIAGVAAGQTIGSYAGEEARKAVNKSAGFGMRVRKTRGGSFMPAGKSGGSFMVAGKVGCGRSVLDEPFTARQAVNFFKQDLPNAVKGLGVHNTDMMMGSRMSAMDMPIQIGSPYIKSNSPAMFPFMPTKSIQSSDRII